LASAETLEALVGHGDAEPLVTQLKAQKVPPHTVRRILARVVRTIQFKRGRGQPPTPAYDRTIAEGNLEMADREVHELMNTREMAELHAIGEVGRLRRIPTVETSEQDDVLGNYVKKKRGSSRRMRERRSGLE
jgi:hypothetical protein